MRHIIGLIAALITFAVSAAVERHFIWPEGKMPYSDQKHLVAVMTDNKKDQPENWRQPYLEWSKPPVADKKNGTCVILISGGGYGSCCDVSLSYYVLINSCCAFKMILVVVFEMVVL